MSVSPHQIYMNIAKEYAKFSKCQFTKVGAIAINERNRIIATGVNGTIPKSTNCCDHHFEHREDHVPFTTENEIHAELNLIIDLAKSGTRFSNLSIYLTISPCAECLKALLSLNDFSSGNGMRLTRIVYDQKYHRTTDDQLNRMVHKAAETFTELVSLEQLLLKGN